MGGVSTAWASAQRVGGVNGIAPLPLLTPAPASLQGALVIARTDTLATVFLSSVPNAFVKLVLTPPAFLPDTFLPSLPLLLPLPNCRAP